MTDTSETRSNARYQKNYGRSYAPVPPKFDRCCQMVHDDWSTHQCARKRGHGPDEAYCKQHDPVARKEKDDARRAAWRAEWDERKEADRLQRHNEDFRAKFLDALTKIKEGHNDPRALATEVLAAYEEGLK